MLQIGVYWIPDPSSPKDHILMDVSNTEHDALEHINTHAGSEISRHSPSLRDSEVDADMDVSEGDFPRTVQITCASDETLKFHYELHEVIDHGNGDYQKAGGVGGVERGIMEVQQKKLSNGETGGSVGEVFLTGNKNEDAVDIDQGKSVLQSTNAFQIPSSPSSISDDGVPTILPNNTTSPDRTQYGIFFFSNVSESNISNHRIMSSTLSLSEAQSDMKIMVSGQLMRLKKKSSEYECWVGADYAEILDETSRVEYRLEIRQGKLTAGNKFFDGDLVTEDQAKAAEKRKPPIVEDGNGQQTNKKQAAEKRKLPTVDDGDGQQANKKQAVEKRKLSTVDDGDGQPTNKKQRQTYHPPPSTTRSIRPRTRSATPAARTTRKKKSTTSKQTPKATNQTPASTAQETEDSTQFCTCRSTDDGRTMLGCDGPACKFNGWFHLDCLNMVDVPEGSWMCPACR